MTSENIKIAATQSILAVFGSCYLRVIPNCDTWRHEGLFQVKMVSVSLVSQQNMIVDLKLWHEKSIYILLQLIKIRV